MKTYDVTMVVPDWNGTPVSNTFEIVAESASWAIDQAIKNFAMNLSDCISVTATRTDRI